MPKRILIAEDDQVTRELLEQFARKRNIETVTVTNGVDLLEVAGKEKFDLVITDLLMPDLNGASAIEILKLQETSTPFIALTGLSDRELDLIRDKFTKIFFKPVDMVELFNYIESVV